jgi:hypothetical protein
MNRHQNLPSRCSEEAGVRGMPNRINAHVARFARRRENPTILSPRPGGRERVERTASAQPSNAAPEPPRDRDRTVHPFRPSVAPRLRSVIFFSLTVPRYFSSVLGGRWWLIATLSLCTSNVDVVIVIIIIIISDPPTHHHHRPTAYQGV